jgi:hypothetical protein
MPIYDVEETIAIKKPVDDRPMTQEQADEWTKCADDKDYWMRNYVYVQSDEGRVLFKPRPYQSRIIKLTEDTFFNIIMSGRQTGKCSGKLSKYTVRNKKTGEVYEVTAEQFHKNCL